MQPEAFSIIAATCHGNRGAQAMLETVIGTLSEARPDVVYHVFSYYPESDRKLVSDERVTIHSSTPLALVAWVLPWSLLFGAMRRLFGRGVFRFAPAPIRALAGSIALVDLAGVAFIDGREKFLPFNALTLIPAWLLGTPIAKMPQATGPFERPANRAAARVVLPMCRMVWARGARTYGHLVEAAIPGVRFEQADDIAFNYEERWSLTQEGAPGVEIILNELHKRRAHGANGVIGICPSSVVAVKSRQEGGNYESVLATLVRDLMDAGFVVVLFPNATRASAGEAERNNDLPLIRRIGAACSDRKQDSLLSVDFDVNAAAIKRLIAHTDTVLVSRFHAMVGALSLGVPPAVLGWSHKYVEVMARFGLEKCVMDYKQLSQSQLSEAVAGVFVRRKEIKEQIDAHLPEVKASARRPVMDLLAPARGASLA